MTIRHPKYVNTYIVDLYSNALNTSDGVCSGRIRLVPAVCLMSRRQWAPCPGGIPPLCLQDHVDSILIPNPRRQNHTMLFAKVASSHA